jgi:hypothetical protein
MPTGNAPHTTAQGVNIEANNVTLVTRAATNGHMEGLGELSSSLGSASTKVVNNTSRRSTRMP